EQASAHVMVVADRVADDQADLLVAVEILRGLPESIRRDAPEGDQCRRQQPDGPHNGHARSRGAKAGYLVTGESIAPPRPAARAVRLSRRGAGWARRSRCW